jgi:hypothetical protein
MGDGSKVASQALSALLPKMRYADEPFGGF